MASGMFGVFQIGLRTSEYKAFESRHRAAQSKRHWHSSSCAGFCEDWRRARAAFRDSIERVERKETKRGYFDFSLGARLSSQGDGIEMECSLWRKSTV